MAAGGVKQGDRRVEHLSGEGESAESSSYETKETV